MQNWKTVYDVLKAADNEEFLMSLLFVRQNFATFLNQTLIFHGFLVINKQYWI